jgi:hypothetical protein
MQNSDEFPRFSKNPGWKITGKNVGNFTTLLAGLMWPVKLSFRPLY